MGVACGAHALHDGYTDLVVAMLPIWQAEFGRSYAALGTLRGVLAGTMATFQIPSGMLSERLGTPLVLAGGTALAGLGTLAFLFLLFWGGLDSGLGERDLAVIRKVPAYAPSTQQSDLHQIPTQASTSVSRSVQEDVLRRLDALRQQEEILQQELADRFQQLQQRTQELEQARTDADSLKQQIASLTLERQEADAKRQPAKFDPHERQGADDTSLALPKKAASAPQKAGHHPPATAPQPQSPSPARALMAARQLIAEGKPDDARRLLAMTQTQMVFRPVTPEAPDAQGFSVPATAIGDAIRWLNIGAIAQAMQAINTAIEDSSGRVRVWSGNSTSRYPAYSQSSAPRF